MRKLAPALSAFAFLVATAPAPALAEPAWSTPVTIVSTTPPTPGGTLSCFGSPQASASYAWTRDHAAIPGATARDYMVRGADLGHELRCRMTVETAGGPLSGTSAAVVPPVVDDGPPRVVHNGASLIAGLASPIVAWMNRPVVIRDVGPVADVAFCSPGTWSGVNGPTGSHWTFEVLRNGIVVATFERDGDPDPAWRGYPAGWVDGVQHVPFVAWHRLTAADTGRRLQCRVTVANGVGRQSHTSPPMIIGTPAITASSTSGVLRRGSFQVAYAGTGRLSAKAGRRVIASGTARAGTATLKLTAAGRRLLERKRRLTVSITAGGTRTRITLRA